VPPQPEIFEGPLLPDLAKATGIGATLGAAVGFAGGALFSVWDDNVNPTTVAGKVAGYLGNLGFWLILFSRLWS
jgi:hypothetical protein